VRVKASDGGLPQQRRPLNETIEKLGSISPTDEKRAGGDRRYGILLRS
jgi:hypothetical protein